MNRLAKIVRRADLIVRLFWKTTTIRSSLLIEATLTASHAADLDAMSPVVSYQYFDSPIDAPIMSPVVSYQYFDWPGDENLTFQFTPQVSYYFGGGVSLAVTGIVKDSAGIPIPGAEVILQRHNTVFWQGMTSADGSLPAATLPAGNFNVVVIKAGYVSLF